MFHDFPWFSVIFVIFHDFPWFSVIFHDFPWFSMIFHDFPIILGPQNRGYLPASQGLKSSACLHRRDCKTSTCNIRSYNYMMSLNILKWFFLLEIIIVWEVIWISNGCFFLRQWVPFHPWQWYFRDWGHVGHVVNSSHRTIPWMAMKFQLVILVDINNH